MMVNGALLSKYGYYMPWYLAGGLLGVAGGALMYTVGEGTSTARVYGYTVLLGIANGLYSQASFAVAQASVEAHMIPSAVGFITCAQLGGGTIALAIANSVFLNEAQGPIMKILPQVPQQEVQSAIAAVGSSLVEGLDPATAVQVLEAIVAALSKTYILVITAGALVTALSLAMKKEKLFMASAGAK